jgi:hypothetical protein
MNNKKAFLMFVVILAIASYIYINIYSEEEILEPGRLVFPGLTLSSFRGLEVNNEDNDSFIIMRNVSEQSSWILNNPHGAPVRREVVEQMLDAIITLKAYNAIKDYTEEELSNFGLDDSVKLLVRFITKDGGTLIRFGNMHPFSGRQYAQIEGNEEILLINEDAFQYLNKTINDLRDRNPITFPIESVNRMNVVMQAKEELTFIKNNLRAEDSLWIVEQGNNKIFADKLLVEQLLKALSGLGVNEFIDSDFDEKEYGLDKPLAKVRLEFEKDSPDIIIYLAKKETAQLFFPTKQEEEVYYKRQGSKWIYKTDGMVLADLHRAADYYRERKPFQTIVEQEVIRIDIKRIGSNNNQLSLERDPLNANESWYVLNPDKEKPKRELDPRHNEIVADCIESMISFSVLSYLEQEENINTGLTQPIVEIRFSVKSNEGNENYYIVTIGNAVGELVRSDSGQVEKWPNESFPTPPQEAVVPAELVPPSSPRYCGIQVNQSPLVRGLISSVSWRELNENLSKLFEII